VNFRTICPGPSAASTASGAGDEGKNIRYFGDSFGGGLSNPVTGAHIDADQNGGRAALGRLECCGKLKTMRWENPSS
jgi:hypothetical protein